MFNITTSLYPANPKNGSPVRAYVEVIISDLIEIRGIKVLESSRGLYVAWPEYRYGDKKYRPIKIINEDLKIKIIDLILEKYNSNSFAPAKNKPEKENN